MKKELKLVQDIEGVRIYPMKKTTALRLLVCFLILVLIGFLTFYKRSKNIVEIKIRGKTYMLEVADTKAERAKGLMFRESLPDDEGMLFIFPSESKHTFWMYQTEIPLDIIWLDSNWKIVHEEKNVQPCKSTDPRKCKSYQPDQNAKYVIEISP